MPGRFDAALLKMVKVDDDFVVYRAAVCWWQPPLRTYQFLQVDPNEENVPNNALYRIENCARVGQTMRAELVFETNIGNIQEWHDEVFEASREMKLLMRFSDESIAKLSVKHICWAHESLMSMASVAEYQTTQAAKAVGSAVDYALGYPFRLLQNGANQQSV